MELSYEFALIIDEKLREMGYPRNISLSSKEFKIFKIEDLNKIKSLSITNASNIDEIGCLQNLTKLKIEGIDFNSIKDEYALEINPYINHITDFTPIQNLKKLEYLSIKNDVNIKKLSIGNLTNLRKLRLENNPELETLKGLDSLSKLHDVRIYGTNIKNSINLERYMMNTISVENNIIDIKIALNELKRNPNILEIINNYKRKGLTNIEFAETNGFVDYTELDTRDLQQMIEELKKELKNYNRLNDLDKIAKIYKIIVEKYHFADEQLKERQIIISKFKNQKFPAYMKKYMASLHSSYNLFHFKEGNCEGHVNLMSIMLNLVGIDSFIVHCKDKRFKNYRGDTNHAMIRVKLKNKWYYCDPTINKSKSNEFFLKNKYQLEKTHEISGYEQKKMGDEEYEYNNEGIYR